MAQHSGHNRCVSQPDRNPPLPTLLIGHHWDLVSSVGVQQGQGGHHGQCAFYRSWRFGVRHNRYCHRACAFCFGTCNNAATQSDIKRELAAVRSLAAHNERNLLKAQFHALVREGSDSFEDIFDAQFRRRFTELINRSVRTELTLTR